MTRIQKLFLCVFILFGISNAKDFQDNTNIDPQKEQNEGYGIAEIRAKQQLVKKKSGKYIGIGLGTFQVKKNYKGEERRDFPAILYLKTGIQTFFTKNIGIRGFFALDMGSGLINYEFQKDPTNSFYSMISLGIDVLAEFPLSRSYKHFLGIFAGIGGGATVYADNQDFSLFKHSIYAGGILIEGGITMSLFVKHRIEFGVKILPTAKSLLNSGKFQTSPMPYLMYNYQF